MNALHSVGTPSNAPPCDDLHQLAEKELLAQLSASNAEEGGIKLVIPVADQDRGGSESRKRPLLLANIAPEVFIVVMITIGVIKI
jgi:hypothetical protein